MIEFAGQKLLLDDGTVQKLVEHYGTLDDIYCGMDPVGMHYGHQAPPVAWWRVAAASAPAHVRRTRPPRWLLNSLWMPTGAARFGIGLFLIDEERLDHIFSALDSKGGATLTLQHSVKFGGNVTNVTRSGTMYLLPPMCLTGECRSLRVLPLVDGRWFWQFRIMEAGKDNTYATFDWDAAETCVDNALTGLPGITWDTRDDWKRPDWFAMGSRATNAGTYIDALCASTGRRLIYSWEDGQGYADGALTALTEHLDRVTTDAYHEAVLHGGDTLGLQGSGYGATTRPKKIYVVFDRRQGGYHEQRGHVHREEVNCEPLVIPGSHTGDLGDWELDIHTTAQADFSTRGANPDNSADVNSLAVRIATNYLDWTNQNWDLWLAGVGPDGTDLCAADDYWWFVCDKGVGGVPVRFAVKDADDPLADLADPEPTFFVRWRSMSPTDAYWAEQCQQFEDAPRSRMATGLCRVELTERLLRGKSAKANVYYYDITSYKAETDYEITVFDPLERFTGEVGERFWACALPHDSNRFEIVSPSNDGIILAYATLSEDLCASNDGITMVRDFRRFPDCKPMDVDHVWNPHKHAGPKDGRVIVVRRECVNGSGSGSGGGGGSGSGGSGGVAERWEVVDVVLRTACAVMQVEDRGKCLTSAHHRFRGEWSPEDDPHEVCVITPINPCPSPIGSSSGENNSGSSGDTCDLSWTTENFVCCGVFIDCSPGSGSGGSGSGGGA